MLQNVIHRAYVAGQHTRILQKNKLQRPFWDIELFIVKPWPQTLSPKT